VGKCVDNWTSDEDGLSSKSDSFEDVTACSHSSIQVDLTTSGDRLHHARQHVNLQQQNNNTFSNANTAPAMNS